MLIDFLYLFEFQNPDPLLECVVEIIPDISDPLLCSRVDPMSLPIDAIADPLVKAPV